MLIKLYFICLLLCLIVNILFFFYEKSKLGKLNIELSFKSRMHNMYLNVLSFLAWSSLAVIIYKKVVVVDFISIGVDILIAFYAAKILTPVILSFFKLGLYENGFCSLQGTVFFGDIDFVAIKEEKKGYYAIAFVKTKNNKVKRNKCLYANVIEKNKIEIAVKKYFIKVKK